jgi:hypothetical protein
VIRLSEENGERIWRGGGGLIALKSEEICMLNMETNIVEEKTMK